jgi:phosphate starvation-inducible protein PhoH
MGQQAYSQEKKLSKKFNKRVPNQSEEYGSNNVVVMKNHMHIDNIIPKTVAQNSAFELINTNKNVILHGVAGTGKTFISLYLALKEIADKNSDKKKIIIVRSVVPTREMGFLPGNDKEKTKVYEAPYRAICEELFGRGDAYEILKTRRAIDFLSTSFVRGTTLNDAIVIVDEVQNMTFHELDTVITRIGKNCQLILCGDFRQNDLANSREKSGIVDVMKILDNIKSFHHVEFTEEDIVRSGFVKSYIIEKTKLGYA